MKHMTSAEVRTAYLEYFAEQKHRIVASAALVPANDPTLLFVNAGMVPFKDVFLGTETRKYNRATSSQKCMRVSGKHNDLEEVGPSKQHHTFFEMLGNFSFGNYFKLEAMQFAWQLLTHVYELPADRLAVTIYEKDDESYDLWVDKVGIPTNRIARLGPDDNFWQMAETGPCGPNSEIHWDKYPERGEDDIIPALEVDDGRFMEIWNLVFMQFNRTQPDPDHTGQWDEPLPKPGVDTGMGFERMVAVMQGADANYETDLFMPIIERTQQLAGMTDEERDANIVPFRVIADHMRAASFLIADGVLPGAVGRDYICRMVIRRAARFGAKLGFTEPFLADVAETVIDVMGDHYTELVEKREAIWQAINREEVRFSRTLERGLTELAESLEQLHQEGQTTLSGETAFYLKATLGLPIEVIRDICQERGFTVDEEAFHQAAVDHAERSGGGQSMGEIASTEIYQEVLHGLVESKKLPTTGVVYDPYSDENFTGQVLAMLRDGSPVDSAITGEQVEIVLPTTSFYVESGGQISDTGVITGPNWRVEVEAMRQPIGGLVVHVGEVVEGRPQVGDAVTGSVNGERRRTIRQNHTATHLLHAVLQEQLGKHVQQRGSLVAPDRLRFDFSHPEAISREQREAISMAVNEAIMANMPVTPVTKDLDTARQEGATALFGEKYGDEVRTITVGLPENRYSYELCGGTHVNNTAEIGAFIIRSEGSAAAGIRRIEAVTGLRAIREMLDYIGTLHDAADTMGTTLLELPQRIRALNEELQVAHREATELRRNIVQNEFDTLQARVEKIEGVPVLAAHIEGASMDNLREAADKFRERNPSGVVALGTVNNDRPQIIIAVTEDLTKRGLHAGKMIKEVAGKVGGGGGGRPTLAQAGGNDASKLDEALEHVAELVRRDLR
ncbi:alanine--tRNA ligase [Chloroflexota bacterium]